MDVVIVERLFTCVVIEVIVRVLLVLETSGGRDEKFKRRVGI
jgi:hypothetical protein